MTRNQVHTVRRDGGWGNLRAGAGRVPKIFPTKAQAQAAGGETAMRQHAEHVIRNLDGKISEANSYGGDPRTSKG